MTTVSFDNDKIAHISMQMPGKINKINLAFIEGFAKAIDIALDHSETRGIILLSAHAEFCAGADLEMFAKPQHSNLLDQLVDKLCKSLRRLETSNKPVVALLSGSAFGGGCEIALACHHRIALNNSLLRIGLPEVSLGLIPGAGGTQRLPRLIGIQAAVESILSAKMHTASAALEMGLIDQVVESQEQMIIAAREWILQNADAKQPWDCHPLNSTGPAVHGEEARNIFMAACAMIEKKTAGAMLAPRLALSAIQEGLGLCFDKGMEVERRYFKQAVLSQQCKDMIRTFWVHKNRVEKHEGLPNIEDARIQTVGILGAGMMGAGLAALCAKAGYKVILKDVSQKNLDQAMERCRSQYRQEIVEHISPTLEVGILSQCDLIIEAIFENLELKHRIIREIEPLLHPDAIWATNTSALPISELAEVSMRPANFIGLHYFSPPEKMRLVEIICGKHTSEETLARCLRFSAITRKLPIVVNDAYAFFTSRVFCAYIMEGAQLVAEGYDPVLIEWAAKKSGMAVAPLQVFDEVSLSLMVHATCESERYWGKQESAGLTLIQKMCELGRMGKAVQQGFYSYEGGRKLWPGLKELVQAPSKKTDVEYLQKRLMLIQCAQVAQTIDLGIIRNIRDIEVGSIFGLGFAPQTGGPLAFMDNLGIRNVVDELEQLASRCGPRYSPARVLYSMAEKRQRFFA